MRITKAMLQEDNKILLKQRDTLIEAIKFKDEQLAWYKKCTSGGYLSSMNIAMERISESCAKVTHAIIDHSSSFRR